MAERVCEHGNAVADHRDFRPGTADCFVCWPEGPGKRAWRSSGVRVSRRALPCVHEGAVVEYAACGSEHRHVRDCERHDEPCTRGPSRVRSCQACPDYTPPPAALAFHLSAHGIGDAVCGVYVACGLADATARPVVFHTRHAAWLAGVSHPGVTLVQSFETAGADANADYGGQLRAGGRREGSRVRWYCDQVSRQVGIPAFAPVRPQTVIGPAPVLPPGYTLLAPWSHGRSREWPLAKWLELARRIPGRVVVVGTRANRDAMQAFAALPPRVSWHWGQPAEWVVAAVANAGHVYANDSGPAHLAGLHGVPCTAITAHLPGSFLFAESPSVTAVSPDWACSPCGWQRERGYNPRKCGGACPALADLGSERIPLPVLA